jgi:hypothetical protein
MLAIKNLVAEKLRRITQKVAMLKLPAFWGFLSGY